MLTANRAKRICAKSYDKRVRRQLKSIEERIKDYSECGYCELLLSKSEIANQEVLDILQARGFNIVICPDIIGEPVYYLRW